MLYSCTHIATVGVKGLRKVLSERAKERKRKGARKGEGICLGLET